MAAITTAGADPATEDRWTGMFAGLLAALLVLRLVALALNGTDLSSTRRSTGPGASSRPSATTPSPRSSPG